MGPAGPRVVGMSDKKVAVVTGANRGIGYEIARQLAAEGVDVVATSRNPEEGRAAARKVDVRHFPLDVTRLESIDALAEHVRDGLDILINNAGISMKGFDANVASTTLAVNFWGAKNVTDRLLPLIRKGGRIVMVSSGMGELSSLSPSLRERFLDPSLTDEGLAELVESFVRDVAVGTHAEKGWPSSAYRVSKVALNALTRILARRLSSDPRRILVNAACPGWVRTNMGGAGAPRSPDEGARTPVWLALLPADGPTGGFFRDRRAIDW
jgi:carbonyl reductase 1